MGGSKPAGIPLTETESLRQQLQEAKDTIEAIRNGKVDALVINGVDRQELYTLESADRTYRVFLEKMTEGAVTLSRRGIILYSNSSFPTIIGVPPSCVVAELFKEFVWEEDRKYFDHLIEQGWKEDVKGEVSLIKNNGYVPVQLSITALAMDKGILSMIVTDLTLQKETQQELKVKNEQLKEINLALALSNHDLQQFASVASHDLQEPLRKIQIFSSFFKDKYYSELSEVPRQYLEKIIGSANRMKVLIIDILNYSRLSANSNNFEETDLNHLVHELLEDLELTIEERKATITVGSLPTLKVIRGQMRQAFQNLISNAIKFTKKGENPAISITSSNFSEDLNNEEPLKRYCHVHVKDNGIGFDEKYATIIFDLFEKLHSKDEYEGTGIGLAVAKRIIEKHNGHITVKSEVGKGAEFIISLPLPYNHVYPSESIYEKGFVGG